jgi:adenylate kinase
MIIFMGLAGSGKSTQGQLLAAHLHCPWISTGNLLRESNTDSAVRKKMLKGEIIDDQTTLSVIEAELTRIDASHDQCILDGSPRTLHQAQWLVDKAKKGELKITAIIHLQASKGTAKKRLLARHRPDDNEPAIAERFAEYEKVIKPIVEYLRSEGFKVHDINGEVSPENTALNIAKMLGI